MPKLLLAPYLFVLFLLLCISVLEQPAGAAACKKIRLQVQERERFCLLHLPEAYDGNSKLPLVIVLHGGLENADVIRKITAFDREADLHSFMVAYPYGSGKLKRKLLTWNAYDCCGYAMKKKIDDLEFMRLLIDELVSKYAADRDRIYVCGYSNGAMLALRIACELSEKVAAVASIGGSLSGKEGKPAQKLSVLLIHGSDDKHVPYQGGKGKWAAWGFPVNDKSVNYAVEFFKQAFKLDLQPHTEETEFWKKERYLNAVSEQSQQQELLLITLKNARHTWPGGKQSFLYTDRQFKQLDASKECWQFFYRHKKQAN